MMAKNVASRNILCAAAVVLAGFPTGNRSVSADELEACQPSPRVETPYPAVPSVIGEQLFNQMIAWIAMNTSYDLLATYNDPPTISFCKVGDVIAYEQSDLLVDAVLLAAFDREKRHIFLTYPWSPLNYFDQSVLLHELIHDVQLQNRDWECAGAPELEAYHLQDKWLYEHNIKHQFNWTMIRRLSACSEDSEAR